MEELARETIGEYEAVVEYEQDDCPEDPRETGTLSGKLHVCYNGSEFHKKAEELFGNHKNEAIERMVAGEIYWHKNIPWIGLEKYSHGGDVYAACKGGKFSDRRWDVSPIVGFWNLDDAGKGSEFRKVRALNRKANRPVCPSCGFTSSEGQGTCVECGTALEGISRAFREQAETVVRQEFEKDLSEWNMYVCGDVWVARVELRDEDGEVVDEDSCGGIWGQEYIKEVAEETLDRWRKEYGEKTAGAGGAK